jgi:hypothetical protein
MSKKVISLSLAHGVRTALALVVVTRNSCTESAVTLAPLQPKQILGINKLPLNFQPAKNYTR